MYVKLALSNAKKSVKDYLIYFTTLTICVSLFYGLTSLSSSECNLITEDSLNFEMLQIVLKYATYLVTGLLVILIGYVNKYMLRRRQKEFGTCILLGIEQKNVALMFFIETLIMGFISIAAGIILGTLFSQVVLAIVFITAEQTIVFSFKIYMDTVLITIGFFIAIFCIIGFSNFRILKKSKLIDMLKSEKKNEFQFKKKPIIYKVMFIISIILYSVSAYSAYTLVQEKISDNTPSLAPDPKLLLMLLTFIVGTYAFYYSVSYMIILIKDKCMNFKYEYTNLFLISSITSKIKTAPILMSTISITFLGAAISFGVILLMSQWTLGYLESRIPYDIIVSDDYTQFEDISSMPRVDYSIVANRIDDMDYTISDSVEVNQYFINDKDFEIKDIRNMPMLAISLSDFNHLRKMLGYKEISLDNNEFTLQISPMTSKEIRYDYITNNKTMIIQNQNFTISDINYYDDSLGEYIYNITDKALILPDEVCKNLTVAKTNFYANTKKKLSYEDTLELQKYVGDAIIDTYKDSEHPGWNATIRMKVKERNNILNASLSMRILGIYLGVVLLMITLTILALQQLSDSIEHKESFNTLRRLGIDENQINKLVLKQIAIYFMMPLFIALLGFGSFMYSFLAMYGPFLEAYVGSEAVLLNVVIGITLMLLIYSGYFISTYFTFRRNIK